MNPAPLQVSRPARARGALPYALAAACLAALLAPEASASRVVDIRMAEHADFVRIVIELDYPAGYRVERNAAQGLFTVTLEASADAETLESASGPIESVAVEPGRKGAQTRVRLRDRNVEIREQILSGPPRLVLDFRPARPQAAPVAKAVAPRPPVAPATPEPTPPPPREAEPVAPEPVAEAEPVPPEPIPEAEDLAPAAEIAEPAVPEAPEVEPVAPPPPPEAPAAVPPIEITREGDSEGWSAALAAFLATAGVLLTILAFWRHRLRWPRRAAARRAAQEAAPVSPRPRPHKPAPRDLGGAGPPGPEGRREPLRKPPGDDDGASAGTTMAGMTRER